MLNHPSRHWWLLAVRGALAIVFGILALFWPAITLLVLAVFFGAYALVDGVFAAFAATRAAPGRRTPLVLEAVFGIAFGLAALVWPRATLLAITLLIGLWAIVSGVSAIAAAIRARRMITGEWLYILSGAVSVVFGLLVLLWPVSGAIAVAWLIGVYAILFGVLMVAAGAGMRKAASRSRDMADQARR